MPNVSDACYSRKHLCNGARWSPICWEAVLSSMTSTCRALSCLDRRFRSSHKSILTSLAFSILCSDNFRGITFW